MAAKKINNSERHLYVPADLLNLVRVRAEDFIAGGRAHAGREHVDAGLRRRRPGVDHAGWFHGLVQAAVAVD